MTSSRSCAADSLRPAVSNQTTKPQPAFQRGQGAVFFNAVEIPAKETVTFRVTVLAKKAGEARFHFEMTAEGMSAGPLKNTRATTISPDSTPKNNPIPDPTRIGTLPPLDEKKPEPLIVIPADFRMKD